MEHMFRPHLRRQYRNPSPFFSPAARGPSQCPHPAVAQHRWPRRGAVVSVPVVDGNNQDRNPHTVKVFRALAAAKQSEQGAAVRIQRAYRGHLVRKAVAAVRDLDAEVGDIEARVREAIGRVATDQGERVRVGEMVMRVLLRLDEVRGVREYRKKVVRRAVKLQEMIDSLAAGGAGEEVGEGEDEAAEARRGAEEVARQEDIAVRKGSDDTVEDEDTARDSSEEGFSLVSGSDNGGSLETGTKAIEEAEERVEEVKDIKNDPRPVEALTLDDEDSISKPISMEETPDDSIVLVNHSWEDEGFVTKAGAAEETPMAHVSGDRGADRAMEHASAAETGDDERRTAIGSPMKQEEQTFDDFIVVDNPDSLVTGEAPNTSSDAASIEPAPMETTQTTLSCQKLSQAPGTSPVPVDAVVGRMAQENARLRGMIEELLEQSALQSRLMFQLTRRVESLEKKVEKMGKKKRKHAGDTATAATATATATAV